VAGTLADLGWNKQRIRQFLWEHSKIPMDQLQRAGGPGWINNSTSQVVRDSIHLDPWPVTAKPENIVIVVAGGNHPSHACWLQAYNYQVTGRLIQVPKDFDSLLSAGERDISYRKPAPVTISSD
jgi:hypothetical protein